MAKTVKIDSLKAHANLMLASTNSQIFKQGVSLLLESALFEAKAYKGFNYTKWMNGGYEAWIAAGSPDFPIKWEYLGLEFDRQYY
jgi:hypothetical protein